MRSNAELSALLRDLRPVLLPGEYVFCSIEADRIAECLSLRPLATFREAEGLSAVLQRREADARGFPYASTHRCITLTVHSSLTAVGLTAAVATALAAEGMSANVVAAHTHDHVFVPSADAERGLAVLKKLSAEATGRTPLARSNRPA